MFVKGYMVRYPFHCIWSSGTKDAHFLDNAKAKEFFEAKRIEAAKTNQYNNVTLTEVAFVMIEGKHYCIGGPVDMQT